MLKLDVSKSTGIDGISAKILKHTAINIAPCLTKLINVARLTTGKSRESSQFLQQMRCLLRLIRYRPISILPMVSKVLEHHISNIIMEGVAPISSN